MQVSKRKVSCLWQDRPLEMHVQVQSSEGCKNTSTTVTELYQLYQLEDATTPKATENPYVVTLPVEGTFEIDIRAFLSLVSEETYKEFWPATPLHDTTIKLKTYTGTPLQVLGVMHATVCYAQQSATLPLPVIKGTGASLMGHNWLEKIILNWNSIHKVNSDQL